MLALQIYEKKDTSASMSTLLLLFCSICVVDMINFSHWMSSEGITRWPFSPNGHDVISLSQSGSHDKECSSMTSYMDRPIKAGSTRFLYNRFVTICCWEQIKKLASTFRFFNGLLWRSDNQRECQFFFIRTACGYCASLLIQPMRVDGSICELFRSSVACGMCNRSVICDFGSWLVSSCFSYVSEIPRKL